MSGSFSKAFFSDFDLLTENTVACQLASRAEAWPVSAASRPGPRAFESVTRAGRFSGRPCIRSIELTSRWRSFIENIMMNDGPNKSNTGSAGFVLALVFALALAVTGVGCSGPSRPATASAGGDEIPIRHPDNILKKVGILPIQVQTAYGDRYTGEMVEDLLLETLQRECPEVLLLRSGMDGWPVASENLPRTADNGIDNYTLAMLGRESGLNAVMAVFVTSISADEKPSGFWFLKRMRYYVRGEVLIDVYDTETATKLLSRTVGESLEIDSLEIELIRSRNRIESYLIEEVMENVVDQAYEPVCEALEEQVWKSFTIASDDGAVRIASGERSGLQSGHVLEVYQSGATLEGVNGHRYIMPGPKIGEVQIETADVATAEALSLTGKTIPVGSVVKIKK
jgi:hypothetical protein